MFGRPVSRKAFEKAEKMLREGWSDKSLNNLKGLKRHFGLDNRTAGPRRDNRPFRHVPPQLRPLAWLEYHRLLKIAVHKGKIITHAKRGSLMGNAARNVLYVRSGKYMSNCSRWFGYRRVYRQYIAENFGPQAPTQNKT